jgi:hypothetical protein
MFWSLGQRGAWGIPEIEEPLDAPYIGEALDTPSIEEPLAIPAIEDLLDIPETEEPHTETEGLPN